MFKSYLKIAFRHLVKRKAYFLLNIIGLVIGMTSCLLIFHYVSYERSYDNFHPRADQLVRLRLDVFQNGKRELQSAAVYPAIAPTMKKDYSEVENFCRLHNARIILSNEDRNVKFSETRGFYADASFLKMFSINVFKGSQSDLLTEPYQLILSESMAKKYFGEGQAVGKRLMEKNSSFSHTYLVTGVFKDYPKNAHLSFDYLISYPTYDRILQQYGYPKGFTEESWEFRDFYAYLQLKQGSDWKKLQTKLPQFCDRYINNRKEHRNNNNHNELYLIPVTGIHLYSNSFYEAGANGNGQTVSFLLVIAIFVICIAWMNYINLATARSVERAREVGVRKVLGAGRSGLVKQFLLEGFLLNTAALFFSVIFFIALVNDFDKFTGRDMPVRPLLSAKYWNLFVFLFATGTFLSCIYPSFVLSAFKPVKVLKGVFKNSPGGIVLRKSLIVAQFVISITLIAITIIVYQQTRYMRTRELGADIRQTLVLSGATSVNDSSYRERYQSFKEKLLQYPGIKSVTASTSVMGKEIAWTRNVKRIDIPGAGAVPLYQIGIDYDFIPEYDIKIIAGRNFSPVFSTDNKTVLLNEKATSLLGFNHAGEAINKTIIRSADTVTITGVVADFHQQGLQKDIEPIVFLLMPDTKNFYSAKIQGNNMPQIISSIEIEWKKYFPDDLFSYSFLDEEFNQQYKSDILFGKVFGLFSLLAIVIACFGLLGLSAYNIIQRRKEVSIRRVLGAGIANISLLLVKDFIIVIMIAFAIAVPVGWIGMNKWLEDFAYRVDISWWMFGIAVMTALTIALITVSFQVIKAAIVNPVQSLRTE